MVMMMMVFQGSCWSFHPIKLILTLWLQLVDKSAQNKICLLGTDDRQIDPHDSTIVPWMADKSAELILHARHEWPINRLRDYQSWKDENLCLFILGLAHESGNWVFWFSTLKILYMHLPCTVDRGWALILSPGNIWETSRETKEKSSCQTINMEKNSVPDEGM